MTVVKTIKVNGTGWMLLLSTAVLLFQFPFDNLKFIAFAVTLFSCFSLFCWTQKPILLDRPLDLCLLGFLIVMILSFFWATDISFVWNSLAIWASMWCFSILIRSEMDTSERFATWTHYLLIFYFILLLLFHLLAVHFDISLNEDWNSFLHKNKNYTATILTVLYPFLLFLNSKSKFVRFLKIISGVLLLNLLIIMSVRGALLAFFIVSVIRIWKTYTNKFVRIAIVVFGTVLFVCSIYIFNSENHQFSLPLIEEYQKELPSRLYMLESSIDIFRSNGLFGVGAGNWHVSAYTTNLDEVFPFNDPSSFVRYRSHNLYATVLAELGLIGAMLLFIAFVMLLIRPLLKSSILSALELSSVGALVSYVICSFFYATTNSYEYLFSNIQFVAFLSIGIISSGHRPLSIYPRLAGYVFTVISICCILWFAFSKYKFDAYQKAKLAISSNKPLLATETLERIYNLTFSSSYDYETLIPLLLAEQSKVLGEKVKAERYLQRAIKLAPNHGPLLISYATFLIEEKQEIDLAEQYIERVLEVHSKNRDGLRLKKRSGRLRDLPKD